MVGENHKGLILGKGLLEWSSSGARLRNFTEIHQLEASLQYLLDTETPPRPRC